MEDEIKEKGVAHIPPGAGGKSLWVLGELVTYKTTSDQTGGAYSLFEVESRPGAGPPPHVQHREDESFWILEGEYDFVIEGHTTRAGVGSLVYVPKGNLHAYKNAGDGPGRLLLSQTPGGSHERFFEEIGKPAADEPGSQFLEGEPEMAKLAAVAARHGIEIPPPAR
jgi:mannose-6-phosphate isomerase-like protein (cupin superfamily)